jgi:hypothetical protein
MLHRLPLRRSDQAKRLSNAGVGMSGQASGSIRRKARATNLLMSGSG